VNELKMNGKITLVGYDSGQAQIDAINAGTEMGAVQQNPIGIGAKCVEYAMKAINGDTNFDKNVDTGFIWADKSNIDSPEVQAVLYK
jgi:ribose transport system substrate-binding protein